ncbi:hypothetical protein BC832DRAFT_537784 [Gaertneriomyces semiglobifer]|nr:hypothetical protein BC832DRAFT_537784 [Gaertneriomyces semiglobifer]
MPPPSTPVDEEDIPTYTVSTLQMQQPSAVTGAPVPNSPSTDGFVTRAENGDLIIHTPLSPSNTILHVTLLNPPIARTTSGNPWTREGHRAIDRNPSSDRPPFMVRNQYREEYMQSVSDALSNTATEREQRNGELIRNDGVNATSSATGPGGRIGRRPQQATPDVERGRTGEKLFAEYRRRLRRTYLFPLLTWVPSFALILYYAIRSTPPTRTYIFIGVGLWVLMLVATYFAYRRRYSRLVKVFSLGLLETMTADEVSDVVIHGGELTVAMIARAGLVVNTAVMGTTGSGRRGSATVRMEDIRPPPPAYEGGDLPAYRPPTAPSTLNRPGVVAPEPVPESVPESVEPTVTQVQADSSQPPAFSGPTLPPAYDIANFEARL